jgi:hypothetical protein
VPQTQVLLWVYGEQLRAVLDNVVLAEYHCRYDWRTHKGTEIRDGGFLPTRFASPQGTLIPLNPQESLILYRPTPPRRPAGERRPRQQLLLFELVRYSSSESASFRICVQDVWTRFPWRCCSRACGYGLSN